MSKVSPIAVGLASLMALLCATGSTVAAAEEAEPTQTGAPTRLTEYGELEILNVTATPSIDALTFRGTVRNPYDESVQGIRLVMQVRSDPSPTSPEITRAQKVMDATLATGDHVAFDITVKVVPVELADPGFLLQAFAVNRGNEKLSPPPIWRE